MTRSLVLLALLTFALAAVGAYFAPVTVQLADAQPPAAFASTAPRAPGIPAVPAVPGVPGVPPAPPPRPILGFALNLHHTDHIEMYLRAIDDMVAMGFNTVEVLTPAFQRNGAAEEISIQIGPGLSPQRADLVTLLKYARKRGLTTDLMPLVLLSDPRGNEWRGKIQPEHWDVWWRSYRKMIDYFLGVANESGVSIFSVGSELLSTEKQTGNWDAIIQHVRDNFAGRLSYSTNWDHYRVPTFWSRLDMIGINGYWDLTQGAKANPPSPADLLRRWGAIRSQVLGFAQSMNKPVLLTEIGYPSIPWGLKDPWNYVNTTNAAPAPKQQLAGYQAFLTTWKDMLDHPDSRQFMGVCFFEWDVYHNGGKDDTGYGIRGKPVYAMLKHFLDSRSRLIAGNTPSADPSKP